jgi:uncharacterized protein YndB with AHSA1/START domain
MPTATKSAKAPRMSDAAVKAKTGKTWKEWFAILDKEDATKLTHHEIVKLIVSKYGVGPWWQQMVTATYEQQRGMRDYHENTRGYEISVSRTVNVPLKKLYQTFANEKSRAGWLAEEGLTVRKATANKSLRLTWKDGKTSLEIGFYDKGENKSQVAVQHGKLPDAKSAAKMKTYWAKALDKMRAHLEK